jgi:hypothetical protein
VWSAVLALSIVVSESSVSGVAGTSQSFDLLSDSADDLVLVGERNGGRVGRQQKRHPEVLKQLPGVVAVAATKRGVHAQILAEPCADLSHTKRSLGHRASLSAASRVRYGRR